MTRSGKAAVTVADGIRGRYAAEGVEQFYSSAGGSYRNPHEEAVAFAIDQAWELWPQIRDRQRYLDLCCGSGEVTAALFAHGVGPNRIIASDPYTGSAFQRRHRRTIDETWTFADIALGRLGVDAFDVIICAYALHLCEESRLPLVTHGLAKAAPRLIVISPHKRPEIKPKWGVDLVDERRETRLHRVRIRLYERAPGLSS